MIQYVAGSQKGATNIGDVLNDPFKLGNVDPTYTSDAVVDTVVTDASTSAFALNWTPVIPGSVVVTATVGGVTTTYYDDGNGGLITLGAGASISKRFSAVKENEDGTLSGTTGRFIVSTTGSTTPAGTIVYEGSSAGITLSTPVATDTTVAISYNYNNVLIPQNDLPVLSAQMKAIPLIAKARRIAIYYSQIAAFQAKTDYDMDLGEQLAEKAVGQLSYEIDTEIVNLLDKTAGTVDNDLKWNKNIPTGISKAEHYDGFAEIVSIAKQKIYDRTKRFAPNYMICASDIINILGFARGWEAAPVNGMNGPYFAGTFNGLKVYVSPAMKAGRFAVGVNGNDFMSSVAVYAPYMPIVPTQLLNFADGSNSQGWSTLYALEVLNKDLIIAGEIFQGDYNTYYGTAVATSLAG